MKFLKISLLATAFALFILACNETPRTNVTSAVSETNAVAVTNANAQPAPTIDELAAARKNYAEKCAACHKQDGSGGKVDIEGTIINAENLTSEKMIKMPDAKYIDYIENGIPDEGMPAFRGKLSDQEIKDVVKFIRQEFQKK